MPAPHPLRAISKRLVEPRYQLDALLARVRLSPTELASSLGRSRAHVYRRLKDGVPWAEADDWAIHFGLFPWEVWPTWADADPADWVDLGPEPSLLPVAVACLPAPLGAA